ncbi:MAG: SiaC family regulatory phosphoprotein [Erysipelotrichaceae bacterium]
MEYYLEIESTESSPYVLIDESKQYMKIKGPAFDNDFLDKHNDIDACLTSFLDKGFECFTLDVELYDINIATVIYIVLIMQKLEATIKENKQKAVVNWYSTRTEIEVIQCGKDLKKNTKVLEFNLIINEE